MSKDTIVALHAEHQGRWKNREEIAERMITLIGQLYREKNIVVSVYGRSLINRSVIQILKTHRRTRMLDVELSVVHTFPILEALMKVENIGSAEVDIGKLAVEYKNQGGDVDAFVANAVSSIQGNSEAALTDDPHIAPTAAQIKYLKDSRPKSKMCLLAETSASSSQYQKLNPIIFESVDESMRGEDDFVVAWKKLASKTDKCVLSAQK